MPCVFQVRGVRSLQNIKLKLFFMIFPLSWPNFISLYLGNHLSQDLLLGINAFGEKHKKKLSIFCKILHSFEKLVQCVKYKESSPFKLLFSCSSPIFFCKCTQICSNIRLIKLYLSEFLSVGTDLLGVTAKKYKSVLVYRNLFINVRQYQLFENCCSMMQDEYFQLLGVV